MIGQTLRRVSCGTLRLLMEHCLLRSARSRAMQTATASLSLVSSVAVHSEPVVRRTAIFSGLLKLFVITVLLCDLCHAQDIAGDWQGALKPSTQ
jgi:hypothetical protein